ncbi:MAG: cache domain-containing protein, partial [Oscillospiraceae bacterium]
MKYQKIAAKIACAVALCAITVGIITDFSHQVQRALTAETYRTLSEVSKTYNKVFNDRIDATIVTMNMLAGHLSSVHGSSPEEVMDVLQNAVGEGGFTKMAVCREDGMSMSNEGTVMDVSGRDYFRRAMSGKADVSEPLNVLGSGEESIIVAVPVRHDGQVTGVLLGGYPLTIAGDHLLDTTYYSEGYGYIVEPRGAIILSSDHSDKMVEGKNLLTFSKKPTLWSFPWRSWRRQWRKAKAEALPTAMRGSGVLSA